MQKYDYYYRDGAGRLVYFRAANAGRVCAKVDAWTPHPYIRGLACAISKRPTTAAVFRLPQLKPGDEAATRLRKALSRPGGVARVAQATQEASHTRARFEHLFGVLDSPETFVRQNNAKI